MMKKFGKGLMLLALAASMVFGFVACGGDDDEKEDKPTLTTFTQEGGTGTLKVYDLEKGKGDFEMTVDSTTSKGTWERGEGTAIKCTTSDGEEITGSITIGQDGTVTSVIVTISATVSYKFVRNAESEEEEEEEEEEESNVIAYWKLYDETKKSDEASKMTFGGLEFDTQGDSDGVKLTSGEINANKGSLKIVIGSTGKGTSNKTIGDGKGASSSNTYARYKSTNIQNGLVFRYDAITIPGVTGKVKLTIECYHGKSAEQQIDVMAGDGTPTSKTFEKGDKNNVKKLEYDYNFTEATPIYISTSEEFFIRTVTIESVE